MMKVKKLIQKNQHSSTSTIAFYDEMIGSMDEVVRAAHTDLSKAFATVSIASFSSGRDWVSGQDGWKRV